MSMYNMADAVANRKNAPQEVFDHPVASKNFIPMGETSELVVEKYNISRNA